MFKLRLYFKKIKMRINNIFLAERIKKYGIRIAILDFFIFLMHRNNSNFQHWLIRQKDLIVQKYLYTEYANIIKEIKGGNDE